jgi:hypothetical protein
MRVNYHENDTRDRNRLANRSNRASARFWQTHSASIHLKEYDTISQYNLIRLHFVGTCRDQTRKLGE